MSMDEDGFLSNEISNFLPELNAKYGRYIDFASRLNRMAQEQKNEYSCNSLDRKRTIANCLFIKILNGYQACIILLNNMLPFEARAMSRTLCDPIYLLRIFSSEIESDFWREYLKYSSVNLRKKVNAALKNQHSIFNFTREFVNEDFLNELNKKASSVDANQFSVEQLAIKAGMQAHYDTVFRYASDEVHCPPDVVFRYVKFDENDEAKGFDWGAKDKNADRIIIDISQMLIMAIGFMDEIHQKPKHKDYDIIVEEWKELANTTK